MFTPYDQSTTEAPPNPAASKNVVVGDASLHRAPKLAHDATPIQSTIEMPAKPAASGNKTCWRCVTPHFSPPNSHATPIMATRPPVTLERTLDTVPTSRAIAARRAWGFILPIRIEVNLIGNFYCSRGRHVTIEEYVALDICIMLSLKSRRTTAVASAIFVRFSRVALARRLSGSASGLGDASVFECGRVWRGLRCGRAEHKARAL